MNKSTPIARSAGGRWKAGQSGNPSGRAGSQTAELRRLLADSAPAVVEKVVEAARGGDMAAAKLILDRLVPKLRPRTPIQLSIDDGDAAAPFREILAAVAAGEIDIAEGVAALTFVAEAKRRIALEGDFLEDLSRR